MATLALAAALTLALAVAPASQAANETKQARQKLAAAELRPTPLFPAAVPAELRKRRVGVRIYSARKYGVVWSRGTSAAGERRGYLRLSRIGRGGVGAAKRASRQAGFAPVPVRIGGRRAFKVCHRVCAFVWKEERLSYFVGGIYRDAGRRELLADARAVTRRLEPLAPADMRDAAESLSAGDRA